MLARIIKGGRAFMQTLRGAESIPQATDAEAFGAFDRACQYYLKMSAREFIDRWRDGSLPPETPNLSRVLDMYPLVK
jgi:hypothetical protein